ncbi:MAG: hypothetical protein D6753_16360 [Planctomycetota bacterium]|nr:MAG: hypothetical protein D6753_16360 [Planctomycetota bacterium]
MVRVGKRVLALVWASPNSLLGLLIGMVCLATGGRVQIRDGTLEFYGGALRWGFQRMPGGRQIIAMTLGHVILGKSADGLDAARDHERVHVRQFERWGPAMIPAYLLASLAVWLCGGRAYLDNPFEREAYAAASIAQPPPASADRSA